MTNTITIPGYNFKVTRFDRLEEAVASAELARTEEAATFDSYVIESTPGDAWVAKIYNCDGTWSYL